MKPRAAAFSLSTVVVALMGAQAVAGRLWPEAYRDVAWIRATWIGNDWITLLVAVPVLAWSSRLARRGSVRGQLVLLGGLGYALYNNAFYMFGAALNAFFPLYVTTFIASILALISALHRTDVASIASQFRGHVPARVLGGCLVFLGGGLGMTWLVMWGLHVFAGEPTPVEPDAFRLVAAMDLTTLVPIFFAGGVLLWKRKPWGFVVGSAGAILGGLYLLVLSVNSAIAVRMGLVPAPGELPLWAALTLLCSVVATVLLANIGSNGDARRGLRFVASQAG